MFIASIDPGINTGIAICELKQNQIHVTLKPQVIATKQNPAAVLARVLSYPKAIVVMEQMPDYGSKIGLDVFNYISAELMRSGYEMTSSARAGSQSDLYVHLISPGHWKPFMRHRKGIIPEVRSQHEKDALMLLFYFVQINHPNRRTEYV